MHGLERKCYIFVKKIDANILKKYFKNQILT